MKRLFALFLLFLPLSVHATTTITGHITDLSGSAATSSFVRFTLRGCGGNQPTVNGTAIFAPTQGSVWYKDFPANATGDISGTIYSTRDVTGLLGGDITCGSSTTAVWYGMTVWQAGKSGPEVAVHAKNTATLNVTSVIPLSTTPVVTAPSGDTTYLRIDTANSPLTGNLTSTGTISDAGGTHSGTETFNGAATFNGPSHVNFNGGVGTITFTGGNPWADIKDPLYGAKCDGVTDDTSAIQTAINNVALYANGTGSRNGGTVFIQPNTTNVCLVSSLNMDNMINVEVISGFVDGSQSGNTVIQFTGTCNPNACLSMRSTAGINFRGVQLKFSNATQGPMIDMQHCAAGVGCFGQDTGYDGFHGVRFDGPGPTVGPIIFADQVDLITFDAWSSFNNASVFVSGPTNNTRFSDMVIFDKVVFNQPGTAAIQNASVNWRFSSIFYGINSGNCIPFLQYVGGYTGMQALAINSSEFHMPSVACGNAFSLISIPAASTNLGGLFFNSNLVLQAATATGTVLNIGNNQSVTANGNMFQNWPTLFSVGTGVSMSIGSNIYTGNTTFISGTLATGVYQDMTGAINFNSGSSNSNVTNATLTAPQLASNIATGTTPLVVTSTTAVPNLKVQNVSAVSGGLLPSAAGGTDVGSTALPFGNLWIGNAATNNIQLTGTATTAKVATLPNNTGTIAELNLAQTWTAAQTHTGAAIIPDQTSGITGTTTNNNANAGAIGEYVASTIATGSSVTLTTNVTSNITSISLTAGDWDVTGAVDFTFGATTSYTNLIGSVSTTTGTIGGQDSKFDFETPAAVPTAGADATFPLPVVRFSLSGTTTVFLVAQGTFTVSTLKAYGTIRARRIR